MEDKSQPIEAIREERRAESACDVWFARMTVALIACLAAMFVVHVAVQAVILASILS